MKGEKEKLQKIHLNSKCKIPQDGFNFVQLYGRNSGTLWRVSRIVG